MLLRTKPACIAPCHFLQARGQSCVAYTNQEPADNFRLQRQSFPSHPVIVLIPFQLLFLDFSQCPLLCCLPVALAIICTSTYREAGGGRRRDREGGRNEMKRNT